MINLHDHSFRKKLKLTLNEMAILKEIEDNTDPYFGWCSISKKNMGKNLDMTKQGVIYILHKLKSEFYIEYDNKTGCCRLSEKLLNELNQRYRNMKATFTISRYTDF